MVDKIHYRWDFIGLSTDSKPTPAESPKVVDGSTFYESNTSKLYVFYKDTWYEKTATGGGGDITVVQTTGQSTTDVMSQKAVTDALAGAGGSATILTTADYNWPENNPDHISLFKLEPGLYYRNSNSVKVSVCNESYLLQDNQCMTFLVVRGVDGGYPKIVYLLSSDRSDDFIDNPGMNKNIIGYRIWNTGTSKSRQFAIADNLTTDESFSVLSAKQGKALNDKFGGMQLVSLTQSAYDALTTKDPNTLYIITGA